MVRVIGVLLLCPLLLATGLTVPVNLQVGVDPDRPVALYEAPPTYRRDSRGRPFKSIIIRTKPSGFSPAAVDQQHNSIPDYSSASMTTTTTEKPDSTTTYFSTSKNLGPWKSIVVTSKPFGLANAVGNSAVREQFTSTAPPFVDGKPRSPTIPFFSISCNVGSSCSQIISARQISTPKPTFKPYSQEEISKYKGALGSNIFPSSIVTVNLGVKSSSSVSDTLVTTTQPTTLISSQLLRIRTKNPPLSKGQQKGSSVVVVNADHQPVRYESSIESRVKWPTDADNRNDMEDVEVKTTTPSTVKLSTWTPQLNNNDYANTLQNNKVGMFRIKPHPFTDYQRYRNPSSTSRPLNNDGGSISEGGGWMSLLAASLKAGLLRQQQSAVSATKLDPSASATQRISPSADEFIASNNFGKPSVHNNPSWPPENQRHVITTKGNKISLITGSSHKQNIQLPFNNKPSAVHQSSPSISTGNNYNNNNTNNVFLPPEVSVSSHVIGLRVKPKSLDSITFVEQIQGVAVETDGDDVNLTDLIMREPSISDSVASRPARFSVTPVWNLAEDFRNRHRQLLQPKIDGTSSHDLPFGKGGKWRP